MRDHVCKKAKYISLFFFSLSVFSVEGMQKTTYHHNLLYVIWALSQKEIELGSPEIRKKIAHNAITEHGYQCNLLTRELQVISLPLREIFYYNTRLLEGIRALHAAYASEMYDRNWNLVRITHYMTDEDFKKAVAVPLHIKEKFITHNLYEKQHIFAEISVLVGTSDRNQKRFIFLQQ
jgi:hypothetical protein